MWKSLAVASLITFFINVAAYFRHEELSMLSLGIIMVALTAAFNIATEKFSLAVAVVKK